MTLYEAGQVTIVNGSPRVQGKNTEWLANNIKAHDIFFINSKLYEIEAVNSSTEIILAKGYAGSSVENESYSIIRVAQQVIAADLALEIQKLVENYNAREAELAAKIAEHEAAAQFIKKARLYIDSDGNMAQSDEMPTAGTVIIDGVEAPLTSPEEIQTYTQELWGHS